MLSVSGYENNPPVFEDLLSLLQHEMRLITKVDSHLATDEDETVSRYQLTHDYLVRSITQWLYRQRCQTSRGRAELALVERTQLWTAKPESKRLPGLFEFCRIWLLTRKRSWTSGQTRMMRAAAKAYRFYAMIFVGVLLLFAIPVGLYLSHLQRQQELAYKQERQQTAYLNDILISARLLDDGDQRAARERLKRYLDEEELQPLVGFEWRHLWERSAGQSNLFTERTHPIRRIDVDPSGQTLVAATWDGTVGLYNVPQRMLQKEFSVPERPKLFGVVLSPNGRFLGAAGVDQIVRVWNVESNALTELSGGHSQTITFLAFSSDGSLLLSAGD
ncbi:MAG: hypothetical protein KDA84_07890, partial [Planctomycetaceae bacterium]|nr:hypothetical protein [Planctomycetaceae bacterium]